MYSYDQKRAFQLDVIKNCIRIRILFLYIFKTLWLSQKQYLTSEFKRFGIRPQIATERFPEANWRTKSLLNKVDM